MATYVEGTDRLELTFSDLETICGALERIGLASNLEHQFVTLLSARIDSALLNGQIIVIERDSVGDVMFHQLVSSFRAWLE